MSLRGSVRARAATHIEGHVTKRAELRQEIDEGPILAREIRAKGRLITREAEVQRELPDEGTFRSSKLHRDLPTDNVAHVIRG